MLEINRKTLSNYLIVALLVFGVTSFGLTYYVFPSYAAPNVSTFFSCETSDGCAYRYNTTQYLAPLPNNMTQIGNWSTSSLIYHMLSNETITINGNIIQRNNTNSLLELFFTPLTNGSMGLHIVTDLNGQPDAESLEIEVNASSISAGFPTIFSAFVDKGASTGGDIHSFNTLAVGSGTIQVVGLGVFSGIDPIHQHSGVPANMDRALTWDGSFSDVTAAFIATGNDTSIFVAVNDSVYIGDDSQFGEIQFNLDTLASGAGIRPTFEFSTGAGGWTVFSPIDATDGMRDNGAIAYEKNDLTGWAVDTVSGFGPHFWIRINRTQIGLGTVPIEDLVQIVVDTDFIWDENGNVQIFGMNVTDITRLSKELIFTGVGSAAATTYHIQREAGFLIFNCPTGCTQSFEINGVAEFSFTAAQIDLKNNGLINFQMGGAYDIASNTGVNFGHIQMISGFSFKFDEGGAPIIFTPAYNTGATSALNWNDSVRQTGVRFGGDVKIVTNNTLNIFEDAVRPADHYSVNDHAKVQITGILIEDDIKPLPAQYSLFEDGDVVCAATEIFFFKLCDTKGDELILGVVHMLERIGVIGYHNETVMIKNNLTIIQVPDYGVVGYEPSLMIEGPKYIKLCNTVSRGELLIAGANGCAFGVDSLNGSKNIGGINIPLRVLARDRAFAVAWEDSSGPMGAVHVRAA